MEPTCIDVETMAGPAARRRWDDAIWHLFGAVEMNIPDRATFSGRAKVASFGEVDVTHISSSGEDAWRKPQHISNDERNFHVLAFIERGSVAIRQAGRECLATPGSFVLFDLQRPYRYVHSDWSEVLSVKIPGNALRSRLSGIDSRLVALRDAKRGLGRVIRDSLESLSRESASIPEPMGAHLTNRIIDLIAIGLEAGDGDLPVGESASRSALYQRALAFVDNHLSDPGLNPARVAAGIGISVRYLHRIFAEGDRSVGRAVMERRLVRSYEALLASPTLPVKEVAFRFGFRSQAHFCAAFRRAFESTPTDLRLGRSTFSPGI